MFSIRRWLVAGLISLSVLVGASRAVAGAFEFGSSQWDGCSELISLLRRELGSERVVVRATLPWGEMTPADGVMVLHPLQPLIEREAVQFMVAGGRIAVIDDHGRGDDLLSRFKIMRRALPPAPRSVLRGNTELPLATAVIDETGAGKQVHPTVVAIQRVALNHATGLAHPGLSAVLEVKGQAGMDAVAVAVAGQVGQGRLFAMSDPSAFINDMLRFPDNRQFAKSLARYLTGGDASGAGRLWIVSGSFEQKPGFAKGDSLRDWVEMALAAISARVAEVRQHGLPWWMHSLLAALILCGLSYRTRRAYLLRYRPHLPRYVRQPSLIKQGGLAGRVALLSAATTSETLALVELRLLLGESLAEALGRPAGVPLKSLVSAWREKVDIQAAFGARLDEMVRLFDHVERALVSGRALDVRSPPVHEVSATVDEVLDRLVRSA